MIASIQPQISSIVRTRIPTEFGEFMLHYYGNTVDDKEHVALVKGDVCGQAGVPVRIHSECFTGDVLGSTRCDCRDQLHSSMSVIGNSDCGILVYLRQEGRGIGLLEKLKAYNLQDQGFDTVDANIELGHRADERNYALAALILKDLKVRSVKIMTNNPNKISELGELGIQVDERIPIEVGHHDENANYLRTKVEKMAHMLSLNQRPRPVPGLLFLQSLVDRLMAVRAFPGAKPFVTVSYAQSIDGSIASRGSDSLSLSCRKSLEMTHFLRSRHDCLLVGINTVLADDPQLTVRYCEGPNPQPVILDSQLRFPAKARLLCGEGPPPIILTTSRAPLARIQHLESLGAKIIAVKANADQRVDLPGALRLIAELGYSSVMVEGGASIIGQFLGRQLVNYCIVTIVPRLVGGLKAVEDLNRPHDAPPLVIDRCQYQQIGSDVIAYGEVKSEE
ncbi:MAG: GTP cyclohydrolase II [Gammaproteobacteria bacterium]